MTMIKGLIKDTTSGLCTKSKGIGLTVHEMLNVSCNIQAWNYRDTRVHNVHKVGPMKQVTKDLLSVCHRICQHQVVRNLYI